MRRFPEEWMSFTDKFHLYLIAVLTGAVGLTCQHFLFEYELYSGVGIW